MAGGANLPAEHGPADHIAGDNKKHIDTGKPPGQESVVEMKDHHRKHRQGPQAIDAGKIVAGVRLRYWLHQPSNRGELC